MSVRAAHARCMTHLTPLDGGLAWAKVGPSRRAEIAGSNSDGLVEIAMDKESEGLSWRLHAFREKVKIP